MSDHILVEPVREVAAGLARWLLGRDPDIRTAGVGGLMVPAVLFVEVPAEFLEGARIDGHLFRPALAGFEPHGLGYRPAGARPAGVVPVDDGPKPEPLDFAPLDDADGEEDDADDAAPADDAAEVWGCEDCGRPFGTRRGLSKHRTAVHHKGGTA